MAPKNLLKNFTNFAEEGMRNDNKPFVLLPHVNSSAAYAVLVNKCKVKCFKKQGRENSKQKLKKKDSCPR